MLTAMGLIWKRRKATSGAIARVGHRSKPRITKHADVPDIVIACNEFGAYAVPKSSIRRPVCQAIFNGKVWEENTIRLIRARAAGGCIVHAGTFFGDGLPALASAAEAVFAFEPNFENYRCAKITVALNNLTNVFLLNAALGDKNGEIELITKDADGNAIGDHSHVTRSIGDETVSLVRIDDAVPEDARVSIIHLDVEGFEANVLSGASQTIARRRPTIILRSVPRGFGAEYRYRTECKLDHNTVFVPT